MDSFDGRDSENRCRERKALAEASSISTGRDAGIAVTGALISENDEAPSHKSFMRSLRACKVATSAHLSGPTAPATGERHLVLANGMAMIR